MCCIPQAQPGLFFNTSSFGTLWRTSLKEAPLRNGPFWAIHGRKATGPVLCLSCTLQRPPGQQGRVFRYSYLWGGRGNAPSMLAAFVRVVLGGLCSEMGRRQFDYAPFVYPAPCSMPLQKRGLFLDTVTSPVLAGRPWMLWVGWFAQRERKLGKKKEKGKKVRKRSKVHATQGGTRRWVSAQEERPFGL